MDSVLTPSILQVTLNGANHGYPVDEKDSFAFRQANGRVGIGTRYGLIAFCTTKLEVTIATYLNNTSQSLEIIL